MLLAGNWGDRMNQQDIMMMKSWWIGCFLLLE